MNLTLRDLKIFKKLGLTGYIECMSIHKILPSVPLLSSLSPLAKKRLKWMDYHRLCRNAALTCRYFGISRKTFHKWLKRYNPDNLISLEEQSRRPKKLRQWQVTRQEELRILALRKKYIRYGKEKLRVIYQQTHNEPISSWKIQRIIEKHQLYYSLVKNNRLQRKKKLNLPKKRITELARERRTGFLIALDTIEAYAYNRKRYILTGIDTHSKIAFARMYPGHGSYYAADFLKRMHYLLDGKIENIQTYFTNTEEPTGPFGAKGIGEAALNPTAAAVANAVYQAIGIRFTEIPMTPERVLQALEERNR